MKISDSRAFRTFSLFNLRPCPAAGHIATAMILYFKPVVQCGDCTTVLLMIKNISVLQQLFTRVLFQR